MAESDDDKFFDAIDPDQLVKESPLKLQQSLDQPTEQHLQLLKEKFGHQDFRQEQWEVINAVLNHKRDALVVMATGYGKSLCFQYPPLFDNGVGIVISPLISLMEDQVASLNLNDIPATFLGSAQKDRNSRSKALLGEFRIIYLTPEFATNNREFLRDLHRSCQITLVAVDEAHCLCSWGLDFRKDFRAIGSIREVLPRVPFLALTATATKDVEEDIRTTLNFAPNSINVKTSFDRKNLYIDATLTAPDDKNKLLLSMIKKTKTPSLYNDSIIVYCRTKRECESIASNLRVSAIDAKAYHAGMSLKERNEVHHKFLLDEIRVVCATVAFGLGINKPDIRRVFHYGAPMDMDAYYQEIGRAGRDGLPSFCHLLFSETDFAKNKRFVTQPALGHRHLDLKIKRVDEVAKYLRSRECRRKFILRHFEEEYKNSNCGKCDICCNAITTRTLKMNSSKTEEKIDYSAEAYNLLSTVKSISSGWSYGLSMSILILRGSYSARSKRFSNNAFFGKGKNHSEKWWKEFGRLVLQNNYLVENIARRTGFGKQNFGGVTVSVGPSGFEWLHSKSRNFENTPFEIRPSPELLSIEKPPKKPTENVPSRSKDKWTSPQNANVFDQIREEVDNNLSIRREESKRESELLSEMFHVRNEIASELAISPYSILSTNVLYLLAQIRPSSIENMKTIDGISAIAARKFGSKFTEKIITFCRRFPCLNLDQFPEGEDVNVVKSESFFGEQPSCSTEKPITSSVKTEEDHLKKKKKKPADLDLGVYNLFQISKLTIDNVILSSGLNKKTIIDKLLACWRSGKPLNFKLAGLSARVYAEIMDLHEASEVDFLSFEEIKQRVSSISEQQYEFAKAIYDVHGEIFCVDYPDDAETTKSNLKRTNSEKERQDIVDHKAIAQQHTQQLQQQPQLEVLEFKKSPLHSPQSAIPLQLMEDNLSYREKRRRKQEQKKMRQHEKEKGIEKENKIGEISRQERNIKTFDNNDSNHKDYISTKDYDRVSNCGNDKYNNSHENCERNEYLNDNHHNNNGIHIDLDIDFDIDVDIEDNDKDHNDNRINYDNGNDRISCSNSNNGTDNDINNNDKINSNNDDNSNNSNNNDNDNDDHDSNNNNGDDNSSRSTSDNSPITLRNIFTDNTIDLVKYNQDQLKGSFYGDEDLITMQEKLEMLENLVIRRTAELKELEGVYNTMSKDYLDKKKIQDDALHVQQMNEIVSQNQNPEDEEQKPVIVSNIPVQGALPPKLIGRNLSMGSKKKKIKRVL